MNGENKETDKGKKAKKEMKEKTARKSG